MTREHRMRVLENQTKIAAERAASDHNGRDPQMKMPLIVEVKRAATKPPRRTRRKQDTGQPNLGDL